MTDPHPSEAAKWLDSEQGREAMDAMRAAYESAEPIRAHLSESLVQAENAGVKN